MTPLADSLGQVHGFLMRFVVISDHQAAAIALWVAHTYALDAAETTPYLAITSPEKRSGKSRLLDVLEEVVFAAWRAVLPSEAVVFRKIEADTPTLLLDEVDAIWGPKAKEHEGLRAMLNAGYRRRGSEVPRCVPPAMKVGSFSTYCPKALAGIGDLPDTIADRSIPIRMERKRSSDPVDRFRVRDVAPIAAELRAVILEAVTPAVDALTDARPELPGELDDRAQDAWEPLLAIADAAGGEWPLAARTAAVALSSGRDVEEGIGHRLLVDCRVVFTQTGARRLNTGELLEHLAAIEEAPWGDYFGRPVTGRRVAGWLRPYGIKPSHTRDGSGYDRADFVDAWARYATGSVTTITRESGSGIAGDFKVSHERPGDTLENACLRLNHAAGDGCDTSNGNLGARRMFSRLASACEAITNHHGGVVAAEMIADWRRAEQLVADDPELADLVAIYEAHAADLRGPE